MQPTEQWVQTFFLMTVSGPTAEEPAACALRTEPSWIVPAAAVASPMGATEAQAYDPGNDETKARYRESDHVKAFYRTNGYETLKKNTDPASTGPK